MTPKEKMTKAVDEGFEWLFARIAMVLGETDRPSYETRSAATEARKAAWTAKDAFRRFEAVASGNDPDEDTRQPSLPNTGPSQAELDARDARDAEAGRQKVEDKAAEADAFGDIPDEPADEADPVDDGQSALDHALDELDPEKKLSAEVRSGPGGLAVEIGNADPGPEKHWMITRELDRVMAALASLAPGCGPEAVRACLCGLEETPRPDGSDEGYGQVEDDGSDIDIVDAGGCYTSGAEFTDGQVEDGGHIEAEDLDDQVAAEGPSDGTGVGPKGVVYIDGKGREVGVYQGIAPGGSGAMWRSESGGLHRVKSPALPMRAHWSFAQSDLDEYAEKHGWGPVDVEAQPEDLDVADHAALRALNPSAEEPEPNEPRSWAKARHDIHEAINKAHAGQVKLEQILEDGPALVVRLSHGMNFAVLPVDQALRLLRECETKGTENTWAAIHRWPESSPELPGRPAGEAPKKKRGSKKAKPEPQSLAAYYDEPGRKFTGD